ncbi:hypothetical protein [Caudoviricetes sp.]|nr:hypothetical protein [Caudoviricetes sp.]
MLYPKGSDVGGNHHSGIPGEIYSINYLPKPN